MLVAGYLEEMALRERFGAPGQPYWTSPQLAQALLAMAASCAPPSGAAPGGMAYIRDALGPRLASLALGTVLRDAPETLKQASGVSFLWQLCCCV